MGVVSDALRLVERAGHWMRCRVADLRQHERKDGVAIDVVWKPRVAWLPVTKDMALEEGVNRAGDLFVQVSYPDGRKIIVVDRVEDLIAAMTAGVAVSFELGKPTIREQDEDEQC